MKNDEYSFVEVVMQTYEPGARAWSGYLNTHWVFFDGYLEEVTEEVKEVTQTQAENKSREAAALSEGNRTWPINSKAYEADLIVTQPFTVWQFSPFGQNFLEGMSSGIEHEMQLMDAAYVFAGSIEELKKIGLQLVEEHRKKYEGKLSTAYMPDYTTVRFVTLWSYRSWEDSYTHEWDSEWTLEGLVDPSRIIKPGLSALRFTDRE